MCDLQAVSTSLGTGKVKNITKEEALLSKDIEVRAADVHLSIWLVLSENIDHSPLFLLLLYVDVCTVFTFLLLCSVVEK